MFDSFPFLSFCSSIREFLFIYSYYPQLTPLYLPGTASFLYSFLQLNSRRIVSFCCFYVSPPFSLKTSQAFSFTRSWNYPFEVSSDFHIANTTRHFLLDLQGTFDRADCVFLFHMHTFSTWLLRHHTLLVFFLLYWPLLFSLLCWFFLYP